jgi:tetratricopeptide (TPR) repeat protein
MKNTLLVVPLILAAWGCATSGSPAGVEESLQSLEEGREAARKRMYKEAISHFTSAVKANPDLAEAWYERGKMNIELRLDPKAEGDTRTFEHRAFEDFSMAVRKNPAYADAYFNRAMILSSRAQFKQAIDDLLNAARFKPRDPEPHLWMAELYEKKFEDRIVLAMDHYEKYVDLGGTDGAAREKVRIWKDFKKQTAPAPETVPTPPSSKAPTSEEENKAAELHQKALEMLKDPDKGPAVAAMEELLSKYGHTKYVQEKAKALHAAVSIFKKKDAPK